MGPKILILGESHYGEGELEPDSTIKVVRHHRHEHSFFSKVARLFKDIDPSYSNEEYFWLHRVAFCNYLQEKAGDRPRATPPPELWEPAERAYREVLRELQPALVVAVGARLWKALPKPNDDRRRLQDVSSDAYRSGSYGDGENSVLVVSIKHPAWLGWSYAEFRPRIRAAVAACGTS
jgi:hypothetical protein